MIWPPDLVEHYRAAGYWRDETFTELCRSRAEVHPSRTALLDHGHQWNYSELHAESAQLAGGLLGLGIRRGDRVIVQLPNIGEFVVTLFALFRLGAVAVPAPPNYRASEIAGLCESTGALAYVVPDEHAKFDYRRLASEVRRRVRTLRHVIVAGVPGEFVSLDDLSGGPDAPADSRPADLALLLPSGSRLVPRTHRDYAYSARASAEVCGFDDRTRYLAALPATHNLALGCPGILGTLIAGGTVVLARNPSPEECFELISRERVTATTLLPHLAMLWTETASRFGYNLSSLKLLQVGGTSFPQEAAREVRTRLGMGCALQQVYANPSGPICLTRDDDPIEVVVTTQGRPLCPDDELRIVDDHGAEVPPGQIGELLARGPYTPSMGTEYGFQPTGDLARRTPQGQLVTAGRVPDMIDRGGEIVPVAEVEAHLRSHPCVRDAAVVPMPDRFLGERSCAYVIPMQGTPTLADLIAYLLGRGLAAYKLPDRLEIVRSFPRTDTGTVDKVKLRAAVSRKVGFEQSYRSAYIAGTRAYAE